MLPSQLTATKILLITIKKISKQVILHINSLKIWINKFILLWKSKLKSNDFRKRFKIVTNERVTRKRNLIPTRSFIIKILGILP